MAKTFNLEIDPVALMTDKHRMELQGKISLAIEAIDHKKLADTITEGIIDEIDFSELGYNITEGMNMDELGSTIGKIVMKIITNKLS